jgi:polyhydroxyalkanoate synthesis regulator phasin
MPVPDGQDKHNDLVDLIIQSSMKTVNVQSEDGTQYQEQQMDSDSLWWKTHSISSNQLGAVAYELKEWERMAIQARGNMSPERAEQLSGDIMDMSQSYRRAIDAKSSESLRDKNNAQSVLLDKVGRNRVEKVYTMKDQVNKSLINSFLGREKDRDEEFD